MGLLKKFLNWCPRPRKHEPTLLTTLAATLHLRNSVKNPRLSPIFEGLISFIISLPLFYTGILIAECIVAGSSQGPVTMIANPLIFALFIPVFIGVWVTVDSFLVKMNKRGGKVLLSAIFLPIIFSSGIAAGLHNGIFDSIKLSGDSVIDLYYCTAWFNIINNGLTDVHISKIEIGNLTCDLSYQNSFLWDLKRGENASLALYYAHERYLWGAILGRHIPYNTIGTGFSSNLEITPTTFREGKYSVVIYTDSITPYRFEVEAIFSRSEEIYGFNASIINLGNGRVGDQDYCLPDIWFNFDMALNSKAYIYSVDIGNVTITLDPPLLIGGYDPLKDFSLYLYPNFIEIYGLSDHATPSVPLNMPVFRVGETYNVTIRTMANNKYMTSITMIKDWGF